MQIGIHPAPGFGELMPGSFVVPHNPITPASYVPHIGELLPAKFALPENPIIRELSGFSSLRPGGSRNVSMGALTGACGCIAGMCGQGCEGMGDLGMGDLASDAMTWLPWVVGGVIVFVMLGTPSGTDYRASRLQARADYETRLSKLRAKHRGYRRVGRAVGRRVSSGLQAAQAALPPPA